MYFPLLLPLSMMETLGIIYKKLRSERSGQTGRRPRDLRDDHAESLALLSASYVTELELEKLVTWEYQRTQTKKPPQKLLFLGKGPGKGQPSKKENF